jgi:hypothetical protein
VTRVCLIPRLNVFLCCRFVFLLSLFLSLCSLRSRVEILPGLGISLFWSLQNKNLWLLLLLVCKSSGVVENLVSWNPPDLWSSSSRCLRLLFLPAVAAARLRPALISSLLFLLLFMFLPMSLLLFLYSNSSSSSFFMCTCVLRSDLRKPSPHTTVVYLNLYLVFNLQLAGARKSTQQKKQEQQNKQWRRRILSLDVVTTSSFCAAAAAAASSTPHVVCVPESACLCCCCRHGDDDDLAALGTTSFLVRFRCMSQLVCALSLQVTLWLLRSLPSGVVVRTRKALVGVGCW